MGQAVLITENKQLETLFGLNLRMYVGLDCIAKPSLISALELLTSLPTVNCIVCHVPSQAEEKAMSIVTTLKTAYPATPLVMVGLDESSRHQQEGLYWLSESTDIRGLVRQVAGVLGVTSKDIAAQLVPEYVPIPAFHLDHVKHTPCHLYVRLHHESSEMQFCPLLQANESLEKIDHALLENSRPKGTIYVEAKDRLKFVNGVTKELLESMNHHGAPASTQARALENAYYLVADQLLQFGFEASTIEVADVCIKRVMGNSKSAHSLDKLLKGILDNVTSYAFKHCQLITYVSFQILKRLQWGTPEQQEKLAYLAFYHDILLQQDHLVKIHTPEEMALAHINDKESDRLKVHANMTATLLQGHPSAPMGLDILIRQHHGSPNGVGIPELKSIPVSSLSPLALVFIVAETYAHEVLKTKNKSLTHADYLQLTREKLPDNHKIQQYLKSLEHLT